MLILFIILVHIILKQNYTYFFILKISGHSKKVKNNFDGKISIIIIILLLLLLVKIYVFTFFIFIINIFKVNIIKKKIQYFIFINNSQFNERK